MLTVISLAAVALASSLAAAPPSAAALPAVVVSVTAAGDVPASLVTRVLAEADAVWRPAGVSFVWRRLAPPASAASVVDTPTALPVTLEVTIGDERGSARGERMPLGWIVFDPDEVPAQEVYVSYRNAVDFMAGARAVVGVVGEMPLAEVEMKLARAMGRALAHEIGHYLLASKAHTAHGLMQASHTASTLFELQRDAFRIDPAQRQQVAARLSRQVLLASW